MLKKIIIFTFLFCFIKATVALPNITASVNTSTVAMGDELFYTLTPMEDSSVPDSVINALEKDFEIIGNSYSSSFVYNINGIVNNSVLSLTIVPKKTGKLTIPSININGQYTNPIEINVTNQSSPSRHSENSRRVRRFSTPFNNDPFFTNDPFQNAMDNIVYQLYGGTPPMTQQPATSYSPSVGHNTQSGYNTANRQTTTPSAAQPYSNNNQQSGYNTVNRQTTTPSAAQPYSNNNQQSGYNTVNRQTTTPSATQSYNNNNQQSGYNAANRQTTSPSSQTYNNNSYRYNKNKKQIQVSHPDENNEIFVKSFVDKTTPYKGEQVIYTTRVYSLYDAPANAVINPPDSVTDQFDTEKSDIVRKGQEEINGITYYTFENDSAIFPVKSGEIEIPAPSFSIMKKRNYGSITIRAASLFPPKEQKYFGEPVKITAKAPLSNNLPAKEITITENLSPRQSTYKIGDNITRTITIKAKGQLARNLPSISKTDSKLYNMYQGKEDRKDTFEDFGVLGTYTTEFTIIPLESGEIKLPDYEITYFNTDQKRSVTIKSDTRKIFVIKGDTRNEKMASDINETSSDNLNDKNEDKEKIVTLKETYERLKNTVAEHMYHIAIIIAILFILMILKTLYKKRKASQSSESGDVPEVENNNYKKELKDAIAAKDPSRAKFAAVKLYNQEFGTHYSTIEAVSGNLKYIQFSAEVDILNTALYSKEVKPWGRKEFYNTLISGIKSKKEEITNQTNVHKLYPF